MTQKQKEALRMLSRKRGASIAELTERLELPSTGAARNLITRLKRGGNPVKSIGDTRFQTAKAA